MTKLSVNVNKIATLRNSRGGDVPNLIKVASDIESFGAEGITIHPRQDERHITRKDVFDIKPIITTEFNIEGYPSEDFINMVLEINPEQVTLVPDGPDVITSCAGWDTIKFQSYLKEIIFIFLLLVSPINSNSTNESFKDSLSAFILPLLEPIKIGSIASLGKLWGTSTVSPTDTLC